MIKFCWKTNTFSICFPWNYFWSIINLSFDNIYFYDILRLYFLHWLHFSMHFSCYVNNANANSTEVHMLSFLKCFNYYIYQNYLSLKLVVYNLQLRFNSWKRHTIYDKKHSAKISLLVFALSTIGSFPVPK